MLIKKVDPFTGKVNEVDIPVTVQQLEDWANGALIQNVMPNLTPDQREFIMTGIMPDSWDANVKERHWQDDHIIQKDGWYVAMDETGMDDIGKFATIELARDALTHYSNQLDGNLEG